MGTIQYRYLWRQVSSLRDRKKPLVKSQRFSSTTATKGKPPIRIEDMYFLNNAGKNALKNELGYERDIKIHIGRSGLAYKDYRHRRFTIDFFISLDLRANEIRVRVPFIATYYQKTGNVRKDNNLRAETRIDFGADDFFIPDGAFKVVHKGGEKFFLMEMYKGRDTKRTIEQLHKHALAMTNKYTHKAFDLPKNKSYNIVLIFENESLKLSVINRMKQEGQAFSIIQKYFRCKHYDQFMEGDFFTDWLTLFGEGVRLM